MPLISIIVTQYNAEKYLKRCVNSILKQSFHEYELILIDNGSTDNSGIICDDYADIDSRVKVVHKEHGVLSTGRNAGLDVATGDYITFVDSDDWVNPRMYEILYNEIIKNNADAVCCKFIRDSDEQFMFENIIPQYEINIFSQSEAIRAFYDSKLELLLWNILAKREVINDLRIPVLGYMDDHFMIPKMLFNINKIVLVNATLYYYYQNPLSISHKKSNFREFEDSYNVYQNNVEYFSGKNKEYFFMAEVCLFSHIFNWMSKVRNNKELDKTLYNEKIKLYLKNSIKNILNNPYISKNAKIIAFIASKNIIFAEILMIKH